MIHLNEQDILDSAGLDEVMDAIEKAYAIDMEGNYKMPARMHVDNGENTLLYMPCILKSIFGTKMLTLFPGNAKLKKPVIQGLVLLNDADTGEPLATLDGARITAVRTGAVGGVGIRHAASEKADSLGLIGAGAQGLYQVLFACKARRIETISVFDLEEDKLGLFCEQLRELLPPGIFIQPVSSVNKLLEASEIVITATPSREPVLPDEEKLLKGKCFIGIGSYKPEMHEFPRSLYNLVEKVLIDTEHGLEESGDLITPLQEGWIRENQIIKFGAFIAAKKGGSARDETMLFKSVGMALFDIVVSELIYRNALQKGIGTAL
jgi:ornithine cyclodeaminase/alanine dehydrogenase-like protein (mu-crystallin family)